MPNVKNLLTIKITIDGQPVENAHVEIRNGTNVVIDGFTEANGKYQVRDVAGGTLYDINVTALGQSKTTPVIGKLGVDEIAIDFPLGGKIDLLDEDGKLITHAVSGSIVTVRANTSFTGLTHEWQTPGIISSKIPNEAVWDTTNLSGYQNLKVLISDPLTASSVRLAQSVYVAQQASQRVSFSTGEGPLEANPVRLTRSTPGDTDDQALWVAIRNRTKAIAFGNGGYKDFIDRVLCRGEIGLANGAENAAVLQRQFNEQRSAIHGVGAYELLKTATQAFLLLQCGLTIEENSVFTDPPLPLYNANEEASRLGSAVPIADIRLRLSDYLVDFLGGDKLPYIKRIVEATLLGLDPNDNPFCDGFPRARTDPCMMELIWSYWQEEGMLVQSINAISMRFQNRRGKAENDPLGHLELSPLRPLNNLLWGYVQDEQHRLSVLRRAHEFDHEYGLKLYGKAVGNLRTADSRSKFIEGFHNLLYLLTLFYKQADDTTMVADAFPVLNALREVHMELATGAHNQFGDMAWTARAEMLMQQWLLSRTELREYLQSRPMVPYKESWMPQVDTLKKMMGWTDVSVSHFHDLAVYGEQLLLSIRYGDWVGVNDPAQAANWARYWRPEAQGYMHAYRAATGVDLTAAVNDSYQAQLRITQPSVLLQQRLAAPANAALPAAPMQPALPSASPGFRERRAARQ